MKINKKNQLFKSHNILFKIIVVKIHMLSILQDKISY